ncbi:MAG: hypothetical protein QNJ72_16500 [Pleurocapsa sp. MO_226.B13]|nr:hypothetical protein [Pleurocapsa sp. MO_226.B13]
MEIKWKKLGIKIIFWLGTEIWLTSIGLDDLADYSEFLGQEKEITARLRAYPTLTVNFVF